MRRSTLTLCLIAASTLMLTGCDALAIETPAQELARKAAGGKGHGEAEADPIARKSRKS